MNKAHPNLHISAYLFHILLFCRTEDSRNFTLRKHFCDGKVFPESGAHPNERSLRCCLSVSAKISLRQRRVRRRIYPSWSERASERAAEGRGGLSGRGRHGSFCHIPFPAFLSPPEGLQCLGGASSSSSRRDATRARNARYRTETWYIFDRSREASHHCTVLSINPSSQSNVFDRHDDTICFILPRSARGGSLFPPSENQSNDCRHSRPGGESCHPSPISRDLIPTARSQRLQITNNPEASLCRDRLQYYFHEYQR